MSDPAVPSFVRNGCDVRSADRASPGARLAPGRFTGFGGLGPPGGTFRRSHVEATRDGCARRCGRLGAIRETRRGLRGAMDPRLANNSNPTRPLPDLRPEPFTEIRARRHRRQRRHELEDEAARDKALGTTIRRTQPLPAVASLPTHAAPPARDPQGLPPRGSGSSGSSERALAVPLETWVTDGDDAVRRAG